MDFGFVFDLAEKHGVDITKLAVVHAFWNDSLEENASFREVIDFLANLETYGTDYERYKKAVEENIITYYGVEHHVKLFCIRNGYLLETYLKENNAKSLVDLIRQKRSYAVIGDADVLNDYEYEYFSKRVYGNSFNGDAWNEYNRVRDLNSEVAFLAEKVLIQEVEV